MPPESQQIQPQPAQRGLASDRDAVGPTLTEMARALHSLGEAWPCLLTFIRAHRALLFSGRDDASLLCLTPACHLDFRSDFQQGAQPCSGWLCLLGQPESRLYKQAFCTALPRLG